jgi:septal ring factor EnvC (AmiA/AmiB activator)
MALGGMCPVGSDREQAKTTKDFARNMQQLAKLPTDIGNARNEMKRQLEHLDAQIASIQAKIDQIAGEYETQHVDALF